MESQAVDNVPHVVAVPFIMPGHLIPLLQLCKCLAASGCKVTLLKAPDEATDMNRFRYDEGVKIVSSLPLPPPEVLPASTGEEESHKRSLQILYDYFKQFDGLADEALECIRDVCRARDGEAAASATCILSDVYVGWALDVAKKLGIPWFALWTSTVAELAIYYHMPDLISKGIFPFAGTPSDQPITCIPGLPTLRPVDYPTLGLVPDSALRPLLLSFKDMVQSIPEAKMLFANTVYELEKSAIESLRSSGVNIQPVGPLQILLARHVKQQQQKIADKKEDDPTIQWLNSKPTSSVLYVAFGTTMPAMDAQYEELAAAVEECRYNFVWAIRNASLLPEGFESRVTSSGRGLVVPFAPQIAVLKHPSVAAFLTHCGWNSVLEALVVGVPMIARPLSSDQVLTKKFLSEEWGVAVGLSGCTYVGISYRDEIRAAIESVMVDGPEAHRLRKRAAEIKAVVLEAVASFSLKEFVSRLSG